MDCNESQTLIAAWVDGELESGARIALEAHLATCNECRAEADAVRQLDADLLRGFQSRRDVAERIASAVLDEVAPSVSTNPPAAPPWSTLLLASAAGFLVAMLLFAPWMRDSGSLKQVAGARVGQATASVARLVASLGQVELLAPQDDDWSQPVSLQSFQCPRGGSVRTGPEGLAELLTEDGCIVRLNKGTVVRLTSGRNLELLQGEIWTSAPDDIDLQVVVTPTDHELPEKGVWLAECKGGSCVMRWLADNEMKVTSAGGQIAVRSADQSQQLAKGQSARIENGQLKTGHVDPLLATSWARPLLMQKGEADSELDSRVNQLLARIGHVKASYMFEAEIRSLGQYGVLPLLRFVADPKSKTDVGARRRAMALINDMAPSWAVADLIDLLGDEDAEVRFFSAVALRRLTGQAHGRRAEDWRKPLGECLATQAKWRQWWMQNEAQYPKKG